VASAVLSSKWDGLNAALLASIYPVDSAGQRVDGAEVRSPPTEAAVELTANWQSPFEQTGAESKAPAIMGMLQTGALASYAEALLGKAAPGDSSVIGRINAEIQDFANTGQGRSGMTKLNSTQVFTGAAPVKITLTLAFRAFSDAAREVQAPLDQLARWVLARELARNGGLAEAFQAFKTGQGFLKALLPSLAPQMVGLSYGGYVWAPLVIESMSVPMTVPRTGLGAAAATSVQIALASLTALDRDDWTRARQGKPTRLFNN
jgi:hypothetical protein